ncbi:hypothetical protein KSF_010870 [Reticulibacter mediterranei]|uniref:Uncharacterized protein n=1 Tax=Reticulibacter mediterranei TaxID=2778369 RepID=A0A8J3IGX8_9CHLR|nr:hypothetical protein KSF_010870 [Reticulibacter mediterranei]
MVTDCSYFVITTINCKPSLYYFISVQTSYAERSGTVQEHFVGEGIGTQKGEKAKQFKSVGIDPSNLFKGQ